MSVSEILLALIAASVISLIGFAAAAREGREHDRKTMAMLRDHVLKARDVLVGLEARGASVDPADPDLDVYRPGDSDWLASADSLPPDG